VFDRHDPDVTSRERTAAVPGMEGGVGLDDAFGDPHTSTVGSDRPTADTTPADTTPAKRHVLA
jgi:hypothetical protein